MPLRRRSACFLDRPERPGKAGGFQAVSSQCILMDRGVGGRFAPKETHAATLGGRQTKSRKKALRCRMGEHYRGDNVASSTTTMAIANSIALLMASALRLWPVLFCPRLLCNLPGG